MSLEESEIFIRPAVKSEANGVSNFLADHFSTGVPKKAAHLYKQTQDGRLNYGEHSGFVLEAINSDNVRVAIEKSTDTLVGVSVAFILDPQSNAHQMLAATATSSCNDNFADIQNFLTYIEAKSNVCQRFGVDRCFHIEMLGVHQEYRKRNIATKLFESNIDLAKSRDHKLVSVDAVSNYTLRIAEKLEFQVISSVTYDEYNQHLGKSLFAPSAPHTEIKTLVKEI